MAETIESLVPLSGHKGIDGLLDRSAWDAGATTLVLTWSAHNAGGTWTAAELARVRAAFDTWSAVADIEFEELDATTGYRFAAADMAMVASGDRLFIFEDAVGLAFLPIFDPRPTDLFGQEFTFDEYPHPEGDVFIDDPETGSFASGSTDFATIIHEIGHALGLKHPHDSPRSYSQLGIGARDVSDWTVMSYEPTKDATLFDGWPVTPMPYDILAIQYLYGANMSYHTGNDTYALLKDGSYRTIWDAGGDDTLDASALPVRADITLEAGSFSFHGSRSATAIAFNVRIENAIGSDHNDRIEGGTTANELEGRAGDDKLFGFGGADTLHGGSGNDILRGGAGADEMHGDAGNDRLQFHAADPIIDGGQGMDRLLLPGSGAMLDLTGSEIGQLLSIEIIELPVDGAQTLILDAAGVLAVSSVTGSLRVAGESGDELLMGGGWEADDDRLLGGQLYHVYTQGEATLLVDADISIVG